MIEVLILLWSLAGLGWFWSAQRAAHEAARFHGKRICESADVQWLDQSVQLIGMRLRRRPDGWISLERDYRFEYSRDGESRSSGRLTLLGRQLQTSLGPEPEP